MDAYIGTVLLLAYAPGFNLQDWSLCDGRLLQITQYQALFSLLGNRFGGDARTTFALPKLAPVQSGNQPLNYYIALQGIYPQRAD